VCRPRRYIYNEGSRNFTDQDLLLDLPRRALFVEGFGLMQLHGDTHGGKEPTVMLMTTHPTPLQTKDLFYQALHGLHCCARSLDRRLSRGLVTIRLIARRFGV
jgi:hypothetical protein